MARAVPEVAWLPQRITTLDLQSSGFGSEIGVECSAVRTEMRALDHELRGDMRALDHETCREIRALDEDTRTQRLVLRVEVVNARARSRRTPARGPRRKRKC